MGIYTYSLAHIEQLNKVTYSTTDALLYHWKRCVWVLHMWKQSLNSTVNLLPMTSYGWEMKDGHLAVKWESPENIENVESHVKYYLKGCGYKKSQCGTKRCGCKNQDAHAHLSFAEIRERHRRRVNHQQFQML